MLYLSWDLYRVYILLTSTSKSEIYFDSSKYTYPITGSISQEGKAIGSVRPSVCPSVRFHSICWTETDLWTCFLVCLDHSSSGIISQGHRSRSKVMYSAYGRGNAVTRSVWPRCSIEICFFCCLLLSSLLHVVSYKRISLVRVDSSQLTFLPSSKSRDTKTRTNIKSPARRNLDIVPYFKNQWTVVSLPAPIANGGGDSFWKWKYFQLSRARDLDRDIGSGHTAYRRASLIDLYQHAKFHWNQINCLWTDGRIYVRTDG